MSGREDVSDNIRNTFLYVSTECTVVKAPKGTILVIPV